jgi:two-component system, cell cycle sensor histidine kinase and response regulator CckA
VVNPNVGGPVPDEGEAPRAGSAEQESLLHRMLDAMPIAVGWVSPDGRIGFWNRRAQALFGYSLEQVCDRPTWHRLAYPDDDYRSEVIGRWESAVRAAARDRSEIRFDAVRIRTSAGVDVQVEIQATFVDDKLLVVFHDVTDKQRAARALRESEARLAAAFASIPDACAISNVETGHYVLVNDGFTQITGWAASEALGQSSADLDLWVDYDDRNEVVKRLVQSGTVDHYEAEFRRRDGRIIQGVVFGRVVKAGDTPFILTLTRDVTAQRMLERKVMEAQRLDSVGRLAGGVAHDFNNLLTVIQGNLELVLSRLPANHAARPELLETVTASQQAAAVTRQLLAFGRKQILTARAVDLNAVLERMRDLIRRVLGEAIELRLHLAPRVKPVLLDEAQLEQVLLNLVLNARDAMPAGGQLDITTRELDAEAETNPGASTRATGGRVRLTIEDSGTGMSPEVRDRIFEPFFTTKEQGKGTGLGLASVYGIVQQSGGAIEVETQLGRGTAFHLDFAGSAEPAPAASQRALVPKVSAELGTVLVVEDEVSVAKLVCRVLEHAGFAVLVAHDAEAAEALALAHPGRIDLLLTDVVMPRVSGRVLADRLSSHFPALRVLFMSGFTDDSLALSSATGAKRFFLQKPFTPEVLTARVCAALRE